MAKTNNLTDFLTYLANTIRTKKGTSALIDPQDFSDEIASISGGDNPLIATSDAEMTALLVSANEGKVVQFTGTSSTYTTNAYYVIEETV